MDESNDLCVLHPYTILVLRLWTNRNFQNTTTRTLRHRYVCSPDNLHAAHAKECLENGKHVLVEKPVYGFQSVRDVAERSGKVLMIGFHRRHDEEFRKAKKYVEKEASKTKRILIESYDPVPEDQDRANVVCNSVVHDLDVIHWLFDHDAKVRVRACAGKSHNSGWIWDSKSKQNMRT